MSIPQLSDSFQRYNVNNDNVVNKLTNNDNDNNVIVYKTKLQVNAIAQKLVQELNNPDAWEFYCKVAWKLPESKIWINLEIAKNGRNPQKYFTWLCKHSMQ